MTRSTQQVVDRITEIRQELSTSIQNKGIECSPETKFQDLHLKIDEIQQAKINADIETAKAIGAVKEGDLLFSHKRYREVEEIGNTYNQEDTSLNITTYQTYHNEYIFNTTANEIIVYKLDRETNKIVKLNTLTHNEDKKYNLCIVKADEEDVIRIFAFYLNNYKPLTFTKSTNELSFGAEKALEGENIKKAYKDPLTENKIFILTDKARIYTTSYYNGFSLNEYYTETAPIQSKTYNIGISNKYIVFQLSSTKLTVYERTKKKLYREIEVEGAFQELITTDFFIAGKKGTEIFIYFYSSNLSTTPVDIQKITTAKNLYYFDNYSMIVMKDDGVYLYYLNRDNGNLDFLKISETAFLRACIYQDEILLLSPRSGVNNLLRLNKKRIVKKINNYTIENCTIAIAKQDIANGKEGEVYIISRCKDDIK